MGNSLLEELQKYECAYQQALNKAPERRHFAAGPLYTPQDLAENRYEQDLGFPGAFPYTRGVQPTMYRSRLWTMRMYAGFGTAEESNARYRYLIDNGATGLSCAFDLPTQIGYDSDDPMSEGEVGKVGVAIDTLADMEILFDHIDLSAVSTSIHSCSGEARRSSGHAAGNYTKRHIEGIFSPWYVYIPTEAFHASYYGSLCLLSEACTKMEYHFYFWLSYTGSWCDGCPRNRLHPC